MRLRFDRLASCTDCGCPCDLLQDFIAAHESDMDLGLVAKALEVSARYLVLISRFSPPQANISALWRTTTQIVSIAVRLAPSADQKGCLWCLLNLASLYDIMVTASDTLSQPESGTNQQESSTSDGIAREIVGRQLGIWTKRRAMRMWTLSVGPLRKLPGLQLHGSRYSIRLHPLMQLIFVTAVMRQPMLQWHLA